MYFITLFLCTYFLSRPPSLRPQRRACAIDTSPAERRADNRHEESSRLQTQSSRTTTTTARQCKISCKSFFSHQIAQQQIFSHTPPPFSPKTFPFFIKWRYYIIRSISPPTAAWIANPERQSITGYRDPHQHIASTSIFKQDTTSINNPRLSPHVRSSHRPRAIELGSGIGLSA